MVWTLPKASLENHLNTAKVWVALTMITNSAPTRWNSMDESKKELVRWAWLTSLTYCDSLLCILPGPTSSV